MKDEYVVCGSCNGAKTGPDGFICLSCSGTGKVIWLENLIKNEINIEPFIDDIKKQLLRIVKKYQGNVFFKHQKKFKSDFDKMLKKNKEKYKLYETFIEHGNFAHIVKIFLNEDFTLVFQITRNIQTGKANEIISVMTLGCKNS